MVARFLIGLLTDLIFDSAVSMQRSFDAEMLQYFEQRGFRARRPRRAPAR